jgi:hypothetical protein
MKRNAAKELSFLRLAYLRALVNDIQSDAAFLEGTAEAKVLREAGRLYTRAYQYAKRKARVK